MAILQYGIGGNEVKIEASEAVTMIPDNRSLIVEQLTAEEPTNPDAVSGLGTIEEVFSHFKPNINVEFQSEEGQPVKENFRFDNVADFRAKSMTDKSPFLRNLSMQKEFYETVTKQLRSNKVLQKALENPEAKEAFIAALNALKAELTTD